MWAVKSFARVWMSYSQMGWYTLTIGRTTYPVAQTVAPNGTPLRIPGLVSDREATLYCRPPRIPVAQWVRLVTSAARSGASSRPNRSCTRRLPTWAGAGASSQLDKADENSHGEKLSSPPARL